jgi:cytochrome oxidase assembly protein ShyY1
VQPRPAGLRDWIAAAVLVALGVLFALLGNWQWRRATQSGAVAERFAATAAAPAAHELPSEPLAEAARFQRLEITGRFAPDRQILLDNIVHDEVAGYDVLTPLEPTDGGAWLLVNRGWVAAGPDRNALPTVAVDATERTIVGRVERLPRPGLRLGAPTGSSAGPWPLVLSYPTAESLTALLKAPVHDYQLLLDPSEPDGYMRDWRAPGLAPERHIMYAGQWWLFAAGAVAAAGGLAWRSRNRSS